MGPPPQLSVARRSTRRGPYLDLTDAGLRALDFILRSDIFDGRVYNVLTENATVRQIVDLIRSEVPDLQVDFVDTRIMNLLSYTVACERFRSLGFAFEGSLTLGIPDRSGSSGGARRVAAALNG